MSDYIDRDKALAETWRNPSYTDPMNVLTEIRDRLRALPAADVVERKTGKWKGYNTEEPHKWLRNDGTPIFLVCSECCGTVMNNGSAHWNYCPNCGAKMEGQDEQIY